jgi:Fe-S oxidoreductase
MYGYPQYSQGNYDHSLELNRMTRQYMEQMHQTMEQHVAVTNEMLELVRRNHEILTMIYQRNYGAYPPRI